MSTIIKKVQPLSPENDANYVYLHDSISIGKYIKINSNIYNVWCDNKINIDSIKLNMIIRKELKLAFNDSIKIYSFYTTENVYKINISVEKTKINVNNNIDNHDKFIQVVKNTLTSYIPTKNMCYICIYNDEKYIIRINDVSNIGMVNNKTEIEFNYDKSEVKIQNKQNNSLFKTEFDFNKLNVGGLNSEFKEIFRKVFSSRLLLEKIKNELGINHIKGVLLYGPPGCGKKYTRFI